MSTSILNSAFNKAAATADGKKKVVIELSPVVGAKAYELTMPAAAFSDVVRDRMYEIMTGAATVTVPCDMLGSEKIQGKVSLTIAQADPKDITDREARERIGDRPVIRISLKVDGKPYAWSNENAPVNGKHSIRAFGGGTCEP